MTNNSKKTKSSHVSMVEKDTQFSANSFTRLTEQVTALSHKLKRKQRHQAMRDSLPGLYDKLPKQHFLSRQETQAVTDVLNGKPIDKKIVLIVPAGSAINQVVQRFHQDAGNDPARSFTNKYLLIGFTSPGSQTLEINETGFFTTKSKAQIKINDRLKTGNMIVTDDLALKKTFYGRADFIFLNYKMEHFVAQITEDWFEHIDFDRFPTLITFNKSLTQDAEGQDVYNYIMKMATAYLTKKNRLDLLNKVIDKTVVVSGYTSAPKMLTKEAEKHINLVGTNHETLESVREFFIGNPEHLEGVFEEKNSRYQYRNTRIDCTATTPEQVANYCYAGATKNVVMIEFGVKVAHELMKCMPPECSDPATIAQSADYLERIIQHQRAQTPDRLIHLMDLAQRPLKTLHKTVEKDVLGCASVDEKQVVTFLFELRTIVSNSVEQPEKIKLATALIKRYLDDRTQPLGSRNCQLGFCSFAVAYLQKHGVCDSYHEIYDPEEPINKQEGIDAGVALATHLLNAKVDVNVEHPFNMLNNLFLESRSTSSRKPGFLTRTFSLPDTVAEMSTPKPHMLSRAHSFNHLATLVAFEANRRRSSVGETPAKRSGSVDSSFSPDNVSTGSRGEMASPGGGDQAGSPSFEPF